MELPERDEGDFFDFYEAAIQVQAQKIMPAVGVSIDRRSFRYVTDTFNDENVYNLVCMVCAQSKTHTGLRSMRVPHTFLNPFRRSPIARAMFSFVWQKIWIISITTSGFEASCNGMGRIGRFMAAAMKTCGNLAQLNGSGGAC